MGEERRPTLEMVARRAGVGRGTVSRVINGSSRVSPDTREAVRAAIAELGYVPNRAARALVTRRTDTVALVVSEPEERLFDQPFFSGIVRGVSAVLTDRGLQLLLATARTAADHERLGDYLSGGHVDGVLLVSLHTDDPLPDRLAGAGVPVVLGGRPLYPPRHPVHYVDIDNVGGAASATRRLIEGGRRRIATVAGPADMAAGQDRLRGHREALAEAGLPDAPELTVHGDFSHDGGARAMRELLDAAPDLDAVFAASDDMALGVLRTLRESGRRVPEDVALVGYDDTAAAAHTDPPLTTVHQPTERMGGEMARLLADTAIAEGPDAKPQAVVLDTRLVVRESG
ncbi:LacI family DNA-binding transcriptional regulator [Nocardiopsis sp. RSe5-2]|uniref:LacI family DNA-binding transcriptional regulator n=1 Tax=Nocardiopsis endophytica TaxID=3018445 RepID=A0ABT4U6W7_9ACTN|nr:LacI family DNA-binding transcriptional regulator [Nocardiopsis endophytica]MDA2812703.1 LacI family DNA-binding transcriptional regulator [Nocardiopsis endophytica]